MNVGATVDGASCNRCAVHRHGGDKDIRQLFEAESGTYPYVLASRRGGEAVIVEPVLEKVDRYLRLMQKLDLRLVKAVDTHLHTDHITGLGALRDRTQCVGKAGGHDGLGAGHCPRYDGN